MEAIRCLVGVALVACTACNTTLAEIHGPMLGIGLEISNEAEFSPTVTLGYQYDKYRDAAGWGAGGRVSYAPLDGHRLDIAADLRAFGFPPLIYYSPLSCSYVTSYSQDRGWMWGLEFGIEALFFAPPDAANPWPVGGDSVECKSGSPCYTDVVHPKYLPKAAYRASLLFPFDMYSNEFRVIHHLDVYNTFSWDLLLGR